MKWIEKELTEKGNHVYGGLENRYKWIRGNCLIIINKRIAKRSEKSEFLREREPSEEKKEKREKELGFWKELERNKPLCKISTLLMYNCGI